MERLGTLGLGAAKLFQDLQDALRQEIRDAGGAMPWLQAQMPALATTCPGTAAEYLCAQTRAWLEDADLRATECARCHAPSATAACARSQTLFRPGRLPKWTPAGELDAPRCKRYSEFAIRTRLAISNVPALHAGYTIGGFKEFKSRHPEAQRRAFDAVVPLSDQAPGRTGPWLLLTGPAKSAKTYLASAVLRATVQRSRGVHLWYQDVESLRTALKGYQFDSEDPEPTERLRAADLAIVDGLAPMRSEREWWFYEKLEDVLHERWVNQRSTLITTRAAPQDLFASFPRLTTFDQVPQCSLVG